MALNANSLAARLTLVIMVLSLSSCSMVSGLFSVSTPTWPWKDAQSICKSACQSTDALDAYVKAVSFCRDVQNYYEAGGQYASTTKMAISWTGALAGTVAAPIAQGSAAKAWAGLSGATNGLQDSFSQAYSSNVAVARRKAVASEAVTSMQDFAKVTDPDARVVAAVNMALRCSFGAAYADQSIMKAVADISGVAVNYSIVPQAASASVSVQTSQPEGQAPKKN